ncbi:MAG: hypothetical protein BMS9Abin02_1933 [Anaerolineae bacterium]|nr:MAG: hypothetical protein BMS9Abin02_1933 [Anaerolineae bacterium]
MSHPTLHWAIETIESEGSYRGYEARHPYCDRSLVEFVLAIPLEQRVSGERWRYLHRRGLVALLPPEIVSRRDQTYFDSYFMRVLAEAKPQIQDILFSSKDWQSAPYIRKEYAERLFQGFSIHDTEYYSKYGQALWSISTLEPWLRQLSRYS